MFLSSEEAQRVHGITADQVQTAPPFADVLDALRSLLAGRRVVVYNAAFDYGILANELDRVAAGDSARQQELAHWLRGVRWCCAKELYAAWWGDWSAYHGDYRWQPLPGGDHSALGDCRATLALLAHIAEGERHSEH